ncbi:MAG TPA: 1-acyl-sn-glycerol-3-phosphate acyltransferase, partial [Bacteroidales bacterium]|nr:1-acyl-sn-glycerol-3-phosphate acyltransferase [Bacteroidales bacterium]
MNRKEETIHKFNLTYSLLKSYERFAFKRFYRHVQVIDKKNIPWDDQYILTPNHQNALMDALAVLNTCGSDPVFMARADIFKKKRQAKILRTLKILPIYRIRDGAGELSRNEEIFNSAEAILSDHVPVCLMPEGNHGDKRQLRPLVKGTMRIALRAQEKFGKKNGVKIVPVGLDYEHYQKFFQDILIIYGQPIEVSEYIESYLENSAKGQNELRERLAEEMKKIMIHIGNTELYDMYQSLRHIYNKRMRNKAGIIGRSHYDRFRADKQMIRILDSTFESDPDILRQLAGKVTTYMEDLKALNIRNWIFERSGFTTKKLIYKRIGLLLTSPLYFYGYLNNWLPYRLPLKKLKSIKDPQFHSSFKFALAMILFPVFYALQTVIVALLTGPP